MCSSPTQRAHAPVGRHEVALEQAAVRLDRLEVVVPIGAVRRERGPDADVGGGLRRALHEPPHVEHRRRAAPDGLGVRHVRRGAGDLGRERAVGGVDVVLEPLPERHRLRRAPQQPGVQVTVVEPGDHGVHRRVDRRHRGGGRVSGHLLRRTDRGDHAVDDEHRARVVTRSSCRPSARRSRRGSGRCSCS